MNKNFFLIILAVFIGIFISCQSSAVRKDSAPLPSFYVNANGDDNNDGLSEKAPFKTLAKAIASAADSSIKIITVIGTLNAESENSSYESEALFLINLQTPEQITIRGKPNASENEKALLDASGCEHKVFTIGGSSNIRFEHIGITGGTSNRGGGAVRMEGDNPVLTIGEGTRIFNNKAALSGGALGIVNGKLFIEGGVISGNIAGEELYGGGIFIGEDAEFIMSGGEITENEADYGGGIMILGNFSMLNGNISKNKANISGGGVWVLDDGEFIMSDGQIQFNTASIGAGITARGNFVLKNGNISENIAENAYGGVYIFAGTFLMEGGTINGNKCGEDDIGGGVAILKDANFTMTGGSILNNEAGFAAGAAIQGNFILKNGIISANYAEANGGGVTVVEGGTFIMENGIISDNKCGDDYAGGGVNVFENAEFIMHGGEITNNKAGWGGGIFSQGSLVIKNGNIINNHAEESAGGIGVGKGTFIMENGIISNNKCGDEYAGGGINVLENAEFIMHGGEITNNKAGWGGGIYSEGSLIIKNGNITNNRVENIGGGINARKGTFIMENGIISGNKCGEEYAGGGVFIDEDAEFIMHGGEITNNKAGWGGGIFSEGSLIVKNGYITNNLAEKDAGGICVAKGSFIMEDGIISGNKCGDEYSGGGVKINENAEFLMHGGKITDNQAGTGGGIYINGLSRINSAHIANNYAEKGGGGIALGDKLELTNSTIIENYAKILGGGILVFSEGGNLIMRGGTVSGNYASENGGAFRLEGPTELYSVSIYGNQSIAGGGISAFANILIQDCSISNNKAIRGGGLSLTGHQYSSRIINCEINNNFAYVFGAAILINGNTATLDSSIISGNKAMKGGGLFINSGSSITINSGVVSQNTANQGNDIYKEREVFLQLQNISSTLDIYEEN